MPPCTRHAPKVHTYMGMNRKISRCAPNIRASAPHDRTARRARRLGLPGSRQPRAASSILPIKSAASDHQRLSKRTLTLPKHKRSLVDKPIVSKSLTDPMYSSLEAPRRTPTEQASRRISSHARSTAGDQPINNLFEEACVLWVPVANISFIISCDVPPVTRKGAHGQEEPVTQHVASFLNSLLLANIELSSAFQYSALSNLSTPQFSVSIDVMANRSQVDELR
ncbi:hypothetical protein BDY21DRAFT_35813 [Lineolata rhizophorae]|uniref:Uncharacterized protein n=1 Tax=Lineolata rhizophorae TaxID=578093 RepID=A0A6A6NZM9_9PEZI|nr:hypothetical protein BDY21DRAFT_35813 [Lineolata rhizophorae]